MREAAMTKFQAENMPGGDAGRAVTSTSNVSVFGSFETLSYSSKSRLWPIFDFSLGGVFLVVQASFLDGFLFDPFSP
jgi:hypothetical protein